MTDSFADRAQGLEAPAARAFAIVPNSDTDLTQATRALYVGAGGDLAVITLAGDSVVFADVPSGSLLPLRVVRVLASSTAGQIVGLC